MNKKEISKRIDEGLQILNQKPGFIFNLEEIEAIEKIDYIQDFIVENGQYNADVEDMKCFSILLNLISKLQKELDKKDKVIDLAIKIVDNYENQLNICNFRDKEHIKEFLFEKVEVENE